MARRNSNSGRTRTLNRFFLQYVVETAAAESLQIDAHVIEAYLFEFFHDVVSDGLVEYPFEIILRNFDSSQIAVVAHAKLAKTKFFHKDFTSAHLTQPFEVDFGAIGETRGEAWA